MTSFETLRDLPHRDVAGRLLADGWNVCGTGDWATVWRSPEGTLVARVSPFEPAYGIFVDLCRRLEGHPLLPRIAFDAALAGGGRLTVMEFLLAADPAEAEGVVERWVAASPDDPISEVRRVAEQLDAEAATSVPFWGGLDHNPGNVMKNAAGELKLVDLFYAAGLEIYRVLLEDPAKVAEAFAADRREYICDIAALARSSSPDEMAAIRAAAASIA
ncbi:hypothetical protein [Promicromonospora iranensis]|uniref:Aminoglycoside phosphotransferase domain-containing protein n=1 Tax=Promicromonospora iranensis TaxID=1105144 RepID=A0ABU2CLS0_9MICO|nr:hypothetical protein [Promicromonospora iranensis]MDR7382280.1 hypothetical protein [Promicromonospora iranensis]